jgi:hypothetical protein
MTWRYTQAGKEMSRPDSEHGFCVEGPVTVEDWKGILEDIVVEMCEQAKREAGPTGWNASIEAVAVWLEKMGDNWPDTPSELAARIRAGEWNA